MENIEFFQNLLPTLKKVFKRIYAAKKAPAVDDELFEKTKNKFWSALRRGYKPDPVAGADPLGRQLQQNLVTFSLFKNHQNMRDVAALLVDAKGNPRTYADFEAEALRVSIDYNKNWLQAEFDTAVKSAQSAAQWVHIQDTKDQYPYLRYETADDERVRHEHAGFDGTTLPVEHAWWRTHFPPNGFRCRCKVVQLGRTDSEGNPTALTLTVKPDRVTELSQFNFNAGITGEVFSAGHTYFKDVPDETVALLKEYAESVKPASKWW